MDCMLRARYRPCAPMVTVEASGSRTYPRPTLGALAVRAPRADLPRHISVPQAFDGPSASPHMCPMRLLASCQAVSSIFEVDEALGVASPFMSFAPRLRPWVAAAYPAIVHFDGTARPQTVSKADEPWVHALLEAVARQVSAFARADNAHSPVRVLIPHMLGA